MWLSRAPEVFEFLPRQAIRRLDITDVEQRLDVYAFATTSLAENSDDDE